MTAVDTAPISSASLFLDRPQRCRKLVTDLPGPLSRARQKRRSQAIAAGLGSSMPVFGQRAGGGAIVDVDGNHLVDLACGIAAGSLGASAPEVVSRVQEQAARFTHTCLLMTEYDGRPAATSVGAAAVDRFTRPVAFRGVADSALPPALQSANPWAVPQRANGRLRPAAGDYADVTASQGPS